MCPLEVVTKKRCCFPLCVSDSVKANSGGTVATAFSDAVSFLFAEDVLPCCYKDPVIALEPDVNRRD